MSNRSKRNKKRMAALAAGEPEELKPAVDQTTDSKKGEPLNLLMAAGDVVCISIGVGAVGLLFFIFGSSALLMGAWLLSPFLRAVGWL